MNKEQEIKKIINRLSEEQREELVDFFTDSRGHYSLLWNNSYLPLEKACRSVVGRVQHCNRMHNLGITPREVFAQLGAIDDIKTHPADKANMQGLADLATKNFKNGKNIFDGLFRSELMTGIRGRASNRKIGILEYMQWIGWEWDEESREQDTTFRKMHAKDETLKKTYEYANPDGSIDKDKIPVKHMDRLRVVALAKGIRVQNLLFNESNSEHYLSGKNSTAIGKPQDVFAIIQKVFDSKLRPEGSTEIIKTTRTILHMHGLYGWVNHIRTAMGMGLTMSLSEFINSNLTGYCHVGQKRKQRKDMSNKHGLKAVNVTVDILRDTK